MDHELIVDQHLDRCQCCIEQIVQAPDLRNVATASLAILAQLRNTQTYTSSLISSIYSICMWTE